MKRISPARRTSGCAASVRAAAAALGVARAVSALHADAPAPSPFLAPPPLTSQQPEAPPIGQVPGSRAAPTNAAPEPAPPSGLGAGLSPSPEPPTSVPSSEHALVMPRPPDLPDAAGQPDELPAHLLVVSNSNDPDSGPLAAYYAQRRGIPPERVLALSCPAREEITRDEFDRTIREPILNDLFDHHWIERAPMRAALGDRPFTVLAATRDDIWAIVLLRGVPLKVAPSPSTEEGMEPQAPLQTNAAAVDSELAMLPVFGLPLGGFVPNPFFDAAYTGTARAGPELAKKLTLVTRLDGPTVADVRRMIDESLAAERDRLAGQSVIDSRGLTDPKNPYCEADRWLRTARDQLAAAGWPVLFDNRPETLPATEPVSQVALYLGWYIQEANGPWVTPPGRFMPGAIAYHLHSVSAATLRSPTQNWVGPLIAHGADATLGMVYEPYLALTPHLDIFTKRLLDGDSFAEAAYAAQPGLSWMTTVVGDPLYRPFRKPLADAIAAAPPGAHRDWLRLQEVNQGLDAHPPTTTEALESAFALAEAGPVLHEHVGDLLEKLSDPSAPAAAEKMYALALGESPEPVDHIRIGLKLAREYASQNEAARAEATLQALREKFPADAPRFGVPPAATPQKPGAPSNPEAP